MTQPTKKAARQWLADRVGQEINTVQTYPDGRTWEPGQRTLARTGNVFTADGSRIEITPDHVVLDVNDAALRIEWQDSDGVTIHVTTYLPVQQDNWPTS